MDVALEFERAARGVHSSAAALFKVGKEMLERMGERVEDPTIHEEFTSFLANLANKSAGTRERYQQIVRLFLEHLGKGTSRKLISLSAADVEGYKVARLGAGLSGKSVNFELKFLRSVLKRAMVAQRIPSNPASLVSFEVEHSASREDFTPEQITALLRGCKGFKRGDEWRGVVLVAYYTGARLTDAANLRAGALHLSGARPFLEYVEKKKERAGLKVKRYMSEELQDFFLSLPSSDDPQSFVFPNLAGRKTGGEHGLSREFIRLMEEAGIERRVIREGRRKIYNLSEHSLRHACVSQLQAAGVPEDLRMLVVGHESKEVHRNYAHAREAVAEAVLKLPRVGPKKQRAR